LGTTVLLATTLGATTGLAAALGAAVFTAAFFGGAAAFFAGGETAAFLAGTVCLPVTFLAGAAFWVFVLATFLLVAMGN
jgi:hypothetical protein